jgi:hypothetical protein
VTIQSIGDSTTNDTGDSIYEITLRIAEKYPEYRVAHALWSDAAQAYAAETVVSPGVTAPVSAFFDDFATGSGELFGRAPNGAGYAWSRDGANAAGDWAVGGGVITRSADTLSGAMMTPFGVMGDQSFVLDIPSFSTVADTATRTFGVYIKYLDLNNYLEARFAVAPTTGVVTAQLVKRVAGVSGSVGSTTTPAGIAANTSGQSVVLTVELVGVAFSIKSGATTVLAGNILPADVTALGAATKCGFYTVVGAAGTAWLGMQISSTSVTVTPTAASIPTVKIWNGGMPGATLAYHSDPVRFPLIVKPADVLLVSCSHNYTSGLGPAYAAVLDTFVKSVVTAQPSIDVIIAGTNPVKDPISWDLQSASRDSAMRELSQRRSWGFVPVRQGFLNTPNWQSLIAADGLHPTMGAGSGGQKWRDTFWTWLCAQQFMPRA